MDSASAAAVWNFITGLVLAMFGLMFRGYSDKLVSLEDKIQSTREEVARDHITRKEYRADADKLLARVDAGFDRVEAKLDELRKERKL